MTYGKMYRKAVKRSGTKKISRKFYKVTGLANPVKRGRVSSTRLFKDVAMLKKMINAEKKQAPNLTISTQVGQVNGVGYGNYCQDITPIISQGVTGTTRNGVSVKLHSMCVKGQILQQSGNHYQGKLRFEIFLNKGNLTTPNIADIYSVNPLTQVYDINSPRALDTFKGFIKLSSRTFNLKQDNYSGIQGWKDFLIPMKFRNQHIKYNDDNSNNVTNGQLILVILADSGNISATTASVSTDIPVTAINTGYNVKMILQSWFYDN